MRNRAGKVGPDHVKLKINENLVELYASVTIKRLCGGKGHELNGHPWPWATKTLSFSISVEVRGEEEISSEV